MNLPQLSTRLKFSCNKPLNYNHTSKVSRVELKESSLVPSLTSVLKSPSWEKPTPDGQPISVVSNTASTEKYPPSFSLWLQPHLWESSAKWLIELSKPTKPSLNNCKKATKAGSMPWEESLLRKDRTSISETHSHTTPSTSSVHSLPSTHSIGSRTRLQSCGEPPTPPNGQLFGFVLVSQLTLALSSHTHSFTQPEKSSIYGQRRTVLTFSKETIEKPLHGSILVPQPGTSLSQVSSNTTSGTFSHCNFFFLFQLVLYHSCCRTFGYLQLLENRCFVRCRRQH